MIDSIHLLLTNGLIHPYYLDESVSSLGGSSDRVLTGSEKKLGKLKMTKTRHGKIKNRDVISWKKNHRFFLSEMPVWIIFLNFSQSLL